MTVSLGPLIVDAAEPGAVELFWRATLGSSAFGERLWIRPERGPKVVKNRVHVDVYVNDVEPLLALGATVLAEYPSWTTLADIEGNEFCAFPTAEHLKARAELFAVCTDSAQPEEIAAWWATQVGADLLPGPDGTLRWLHQCAGWDGVIWKFVPTPDERIAPNRWQWSVSEPIDGVFTDPEGNEFSAAR